MPTTHEYTWPEIFKNIFEILKMLAKKIIYLILLILILALVIAGLGAILRLLRRK